MTDPRLHLTRRELVAGGVVAGSAALLGIGARAAALPVDYPFTLGVTSGDPASDGMVLWTRLAPKPLEGDGGMPARRVPVRWEVAADPDFRKRIASGEAVAEPEWGHSVHVEVAGLMPDRPYWYRFLALGETSPVGRTRTAPLPGAPVAKLRFAYGSCQKYEAGHYAAHAHIAAAEPDLILFLGDYIYEGNPSPKALRSHLNPEPFDLAGYRVRYATYKLDPQLQASHAAAPWAVIWDDHEVENDYANDIDQRNGDPVAFLRRRAAAYKAYWEHMPLRRDARPDGPALKLYRTLQWGDLATFQLIDDRQYRSSRPCQPPELALQHKKYASNLPTCAEREDPARSLLGAPQEQWLHDAFSASRSKWNLLAQQTLMSPYPRLDPTAPDQPPRLYGFDGWEGYPATRERILRHWRDAKIANPLVLSGDIHAFVAAEMPDPDRPDADPIACEFVGGSFTSHGDDAHLQANTARDPGYRFANGAARGYAAVELDHSEARIVFQTTTDVTKADSAVTPLARFRIGTGERRMEVLA
ncbi:MAG: alkaline phosphatase D family protein [Sphingomonas sp.]